MEVFGADNKPFVARVHGAEALLYEDHISSIKLIGMNKHGGSEDFTFLKDRALDIKATYDDRITPMTSIIIEEEDLDGTILSQI